ncbi:hypothetical protein GCM10009122_21950 [Fulvivirga kasyanovii]|uniref:hypothetical protein n=1 Tax=Fulvivirga kasyanovii TaxID=396812 RepID=UPI0031D72497
MKRKTFTLGNVIIILVIIVTLLGIEIIIDFDKDESRYKYSQVFNPVRNEMGIPLIQDDWIIIDNRFKDTTTWAKNRFVQDSVPFHYYKDVIIRDDTIYQERDIFHYEMSEDKAYRIACTYTYSQEITEFRFIKYFRGAYPPNISFDVNKEFVDSVLLKWNLPLYYSKQH